MSGSAGDELSALSADLRGWLEYQRASAGRSAWGEGPKLPAPPQPAATRSSAPASTSTPRPTPQRTSTPLPAAPAAPRPGGSPAPAPRRGPPAPRFVRSAEPPRPEPRAEGPSPAEAPSLALLEGALQGCTRCRLSEQRSNLVFGVGSETADVMFVGEGPGYNEDRTGEPFVGQAGELLTRIINNVLRLERSDVYIANVVKCRPPGNRNPEPDEVATCSPFLRRQIELVKPAVIVALGRFAIQTLLQTQESVGRLRGRAHPFGDAVLVPTYHPAYLLRNPADKRKVFEDMKIVRAELAARTGAELAPIASRRGPPAG